MHISKQTYARSSLYQVSTDNRERRPTPSFRSYRSQLIKYSLILFVAGILLGAIAVYSLPSQTVTISNGVYPSAYSYTVWRDGTTYYGKSATGSIDFSSANASYVINSCLASTGTTYLKAGLYELTRGIKVTVEASVLKGEVRGSDTAELVLNHGVNEDVISSDSVKYNFRCEDIIINGHNDGNSAGNGIDYTNLNGADFIRIQVRNCKGAGFYSEGGGAYFYRCVASDNNGSGFYIYNNYGSGFFQCYTRNNDNHGYFIGSNGTGCGDLNFVNCETDGGDDEHDGFHIVGQNTRRVQLTNCQLLNMHGSGLYVGDYASIVQVTGGNFYNCDEYGIDLNRATWSSITASVAQNHLHGIFIHNASIQNRIIGCTVDSNSQSSVGTYDGIRIDSSSTNEVLGTVVRGYEHIHKYGIIVMGTSPDRNLIIGCSVFDSLTDDISVSGTDTYIIHSFEDTTYVDKTP